MILDSNSSTVTTVGDVQENQISIDASNLEHIISILSTNLYSKPEQSFLREIVSNAIDAQVEANSPEPAIISMTYDSAAFKYVLAIRDYGTGISPERFKEIYLNIGSSTKRESNDYIGSFGIGRFSSLACADMVHITSYYHGTMYQYLMLKNGTKINVDLIAEVPTEERDGVEVKILVSSLVPYKNALRYLWFIPNVYVHEESGIGSSSEVTRFNDRELYRFKTFAYNNIGDSRCFVLLGNILYPIDLKYIPSKYSSSHDIDDVWERIIPCFAIGELDVTPNREELLYSDKTRKAIERKFDEVVGELIDICNKCSSEEFDNILEFHNKITSSYYELYLDPGKLCNLLISDGCFLRQHIIYRYKNDDPLARDKQVGEALSRLRWKYLGKIFNNLIVFEDDSFYTQKQIDGGRTRRGRVDVLSMLEGKFSVKLFYVPKPDKLRSEIFKKYLTEKAEAFSNERVLFMFTWDKPSYRSFIKKDGICVTQENSLNAIDWHKSLWLIRELKKIVKISIYRYDPINSKDYLQFRASILEENKKERKENKKFSQSIRFYAELWKSDGYYPYRTDKIDVKNVDDLLQSVSNKCSYWIKKRVVPVYWGVLDDPYISILRAFRGGKQDMVVLTVAKSNERYLKRVTLPSHWQHVTLDMLMNSRDLMRYMTYRDKRVSPFAACMSVLCRSKDSRLSSYAYKASHYCISNDNVTYTPEFQQLVQDYKGPYDLNMIEGYNIIDKYNGISSSLRGILTLGNGTMTELSSYVAMKRKLFRPNWEEYSKIVKSLNVKGQTENEEDN